MHNTSNYNNLYIIGYMSPTSITQNINRWYNSKIFETSVLLFSICQTRPDFWNNFLWIGCANFLWDRYYEYIVSCLDYFTIVSTINVLSKWGGSHIANYV